VSLQERQRAALEKDGGVYADGFQSNLCLVHIWLFAILKGWTAENEASRQRERAFISWEENVLGHVENVVSEHANYYDQKYNH
jgi:hypothetical protein